MQFFYFYIRPIKFDKSSVACFRLIFRLSESISSLRKTIFIFIHLPFFPSIFHFLVSFVCYHFGSFGSFGYRVAKVGKFLEKGNQMTHFTLADIRFNFWPNQGFFQIKIVFQLYHVVLFSILN